MRAHRVGDDRSAEQQPVREGPFPVRTGAPRRLRATPKRVKRVVFSVPNGWRAYPYAGTEVALASPRAEEGICPNVNLVCEPWDGDAEAYGAACLLALKRSDRAALLSTRAVFTAGVVGLEVDTLWGGGAPYRTRQRFLARDARGYVITFTAAASAFERSEPVCRAIFASLRLES